jgi:CDP-glycerol glycerophosphotransferase
MEALILNKPIISTNIAGPYEFLNQGYGHIVENSEEGLLQGMNDFAQGKITDLIPFDAEKFNQTAIEEIKALFD